MAILNGLRKSVYFLALLLAISLCMNFFAVVRIKELADKTERMEQTLDRAAEDLLDMAHIIDSLPKP